MDDMSKRFYLHRINYLECENKKLQDKIDLLNRIIKDYEDKNEIAVRFVRDRINELTNSRIEEEKEISKHLVYHMFVAILNTIGEDIYE